MKKQMEITRRKLLLGGSADLGASALLGPQKAMAADGVVTPFSNYNGNALLPPGRIGIQLYTVRDQIENLGFARTFEILRGIGFTSVEFAGYTQGTGPITTKEIRKLLTANDLIGIGSHAAQDDASIKAAVDLDLPYTGIAILFPQGGDRAGWEQTAEAMNAFGKKSSKHGVKFYWHLHGPEYAPVLDEPAVRGLDILLEHTDKDYVALEMDIYWAYFFQTTFPGYDPLEYVTKYRDRFELFHVKDGKKDAKGTWSNPGDISDVGQGHIDFERFFQQLGGPLDHWYINERDNADRHSQGSFCSAQCSYLYMRYGLRR